MLQVTQSSDLSDESVATASEQAIKGKNSTHMPKKPQKLYLAINIAVERHVSFGSLCRLFDQSASPCSINTLLFVNLEACVLIVQKTLYSLDI